MLKIRNLKEEKIDLKWFPYRVARRFDLYSTVYGKCCSIILKIGVDSNSTFQFKITMLDFQDIENTLDLDLYAYSHILDTLGFSTNLDKAKLLLNPSKHHLENSKVFDIGNIFTGSTPYKEDPHKSWDYLFAPNEELRKYSEELLMRIIDSIEGSNENYIGTFYKDFIHSNVDKCFNLYLSFYYDTWKDVYGFDDDQYFDAIGYVIKKKFNDKNLVIDKSKYYYGLTKIQYEELKRDFENKELWIKTIKPYFDELYTKMEKLKLIYNDTLILSQIYVKNLLDKAASDLFIEKQNIIKYLSKELLNNIEEVAKYKDAYDFMDSHPISSEEVFNSIIGDNISKINRIIGGFKSELEKPKIKEPPKRKIWFSFKRRNK